MSASDFSQFSLDSLDAFYQKVSNIIRTEIMNGYSVDHPALGPALARMDAMVRDYHARGLRAPDEHY